MRRAPHRVAGDLERDCVARARPLVAEHPRMSFPATVGNRAATRFFTTAAAGSPAASVLRSPIPAGSVPEAALAHMRRDPPPAQDFPAGDVSNVVSSAAFGAGLKQAILGGARTNPNHWTARRVGEWRPSPDARDDTVRPGFTATFHVLKMPTRRFDERGGPRSMKSRVTATMRDLARNPGDVIEGAGGVLQAVADGTQVAAEAGSGGVAGVRGLVMRLLLRRARRSTRSNFDDAWVLRESKGAERLGFTSIVTVRFAQISQASRNLTFPEAFIHTHGAGGSYGTRRFDPPSGRVFQTFGPVAGATMDTAVSFPSGRYEPGWNTLWQGSRFVEMDLRPAPITPETI